MNKKGTPKSKMTGICMRGSVDISDIDKYPDAVYWKMNAKGALKKVYELIPESEDERINKILSLYWNKDHTWMQICIKTERVRDLIKALVGKNDSVVE